MIRKGKKGNKRNDEYIKRKGSFCAKVGSIKLELDRSKLQHLLCTDWCISLSWTGSYFMNFLRLPVVWIDNNRCLQTGGAIKVHFSENSYLSSAFWVFHCSFLECLITKSWFDYRQIFKRHRTTNRWCLWLNPYWMRRGSRFCLFCHKKQKKFRGKMRKS